MQNKPNFRKAEMKLNFYSIRGYENETAFSLRKNKPNQTQPVVSLSNLFQRAILIKNSCPFLSIIGQLTADYLIKKKLKTWKKRLDF